MRSTDNVSIDWRTGLPVLEGRRLVLREPHASDAPALFSLLSNEAVSRFISPPPADVPGFEKYIAWVQQQRAAGQYVCFTVVSRAAGQPVGLIHVRALSPAFATADWGFALGNDFWGTGTFSEAAELVLDFTFDVLKTHRLEARAAVCNARGNAAMKKLGAEREGILRQSFFRNGDYLDQVIWSLLREDWKKRRQEKAIWGSGVVH
jgi:RimJ/RimL family protein N-acetyltransferase